MTGDRLHARRLTGSARSASPKFARQGQRVAYLLLSFCLAGCGTAVTPNLLDPQGPAAAEIADLWWLMFWLAMAVFAAVLVLYFLAIYRSRQRQPDDPEPFAARPAFLVTAGVVVPTIILVTLLVATLGTSRALMVSQSVEMLTIDVVGHQWWWEVRYPDQGIVTANEIHIPVGETVEFRVTSDDVIHSFWIPQLHGKIDMLDGKNHMLHLTASEPGLYRGICAEFCGMQHTFMAFWVIAHSPESYADWIAEQQRGSVQPTTATQQEGAALFINSGCEHCHVIRDITRPESELGLVGPDLTHLASRETLAAGTIENTEANLAQWILDPHDIKPGVHMPPSQFSDEELEALVSFLMSLR